MTQNINNIVTPHQGAQTDLINIRKLMLMMLGNWYYFVLALALAITASFFYIKYTIPTYRIASTILIEESDNTSIPGIDNNLLEGFGVRPGAQNVDNQILILSSWTMINRTLKELPYETVYYRKGLFKKVSYYPLDPIKVIPGPGGKIPYDVEFSFYNYDGDIYQLSTKSKSGIELDTFISFGQTIATDYGSFTLLPHPEYEDIYKSGDKIYFKFNSQESLIDNYRKKLNVEAASREGTIISLSLEGTNKTKEMVFLDKLTEVFMINNLEKKNHEASRIIEFIDEQLVDVSDSLMITENELQEFRSRNRIMDVSAQAQQIIDQAVVLENEKARLALVANYYDYLNEYLSKENNQEVPISPATMGIEDPLLGRLMQELAGLQAEYFGSGVGERNPLQGQLELRIHNTKQSIRETLQGIKLANQMAIDENREQINRLNAKASGLPVTERQLLGFERKFNLNNVLYTFLLQKRAEAQIQKASNRPDNELIDPARADIKPIAPNPAMIYLIGLILGMGIPLISISLNSIIRNKVSSEADLTAITPLPVVGHIPHSRLSYNAVVLNEPQSRIAEAFRSLRTRMEFFTRDTECPIILVTSSIPGEGKTFTAINLASAYSLAGKNTLLVGFDLRKPTLSKSFELSEEIGISTYLIGKNTLDEIIVKTANTNLHLLPSGPIPPNPGELASTERTISLFEILKERYDYIVVDSAPIGVVSDGYTVAAIADATIMMVRHNYSNKVILRSTLSEAQANGISGISMLINDLKSAKSSYRYSYNYKYEYKKKKT